MPDSCPFPRFGPFSAGFKSVNVVASQLQAHTPMVACLKIEYCISIQRSICILLSYRIFDPSVNLLKSILPNPTYDMAVKTEILLLTNI